MGRSQTTMPTRQNLEKHLMRGFPTVQVEEVIYGPMADELVELFPSGPATWMGERR